MKRLILLCFLCSISAAVFGFTTRYYPNSATAPTGSTTSYCTGASNVAYTATVNMCGTTSTGLISNSITPRWYFNGSLVYSGPATTPFSFGSYTVTMPAGSITFPTAGTFSGASGLIVRLESSEIVPGGCSGSPVASSSTTITVNSPPSAIVGPGTVCTGSTGTLTNSTPGGTWSSSAAGIATVGASTGVVTGVAAGTATITYTTGPTCLTTTVITVNTTPVGGTITGTASVCAGFTTTLTNPSATAGGNWLSGSTSVATVNATTGVVTGVSGGTALITYTVTTPCGTASATRVVTVNAPPSPITGFLGICTGSNTTLSSATSGGTWSSSNAAVAPVSSTGVVSGASIGTATITYTASGCPALVTVTVSTGPGPITPASATAVCMGATITLGNSVPGGSWTSSLPSVASAGLATGVITGMSPGGATITYAIGSCTVTRDILVNSNPAPVEPFTPIAICEGGTAVVSNATPLGTWSSSPTAVATVSGSGMISGVAAGTATISYSISTGCFTSKVITVNPNPPAIGGSPNVCIGSTTTLTNAMSGGTWTLTGASTATIGSSTGVVTGMAAGTASVTYTNSSTGCLNTAIVNVGAPPVAITGANQICAAGATTTLSNLTAGGTWSSSSIPTATVTAGGVVTGGTAGFVVISYTTPGCASATHNMTVNALPAPIAGIMGICNGAPSTLYNTTAGGKWYIRDAAPVATMDSMTGVISGYAMGVDTVIYQMPGGCQVTAAITVNPLAPIAGPDTICAGGTGYLTNIVGGGTWTSGNPAVLDVGLTTGVATTYVPGPSYVMYTLYTGCFVTKLVMVKPQIPAISGAEQMCSGAVATLANTVPGGTWSSSNAFVAAIDTDGVVIAGTGDTALIQYIAPGVGCRARLTLTVNPKPIPAITYSGHSTHKLSTAPFYVSYQWYDSTIGLIPGANAFSYTIDVNKSEYYYVVVTDIFGCLGHNGYDFRSPTGVGSVPGTHVNIYPNPATETVHVIADRRVRVVISDMAGRKEMEVPDASDVNISALSNGIYLMAVYDDDGALLTQQKLVKQ